MAYVAKEESSISKHQTPTQQAVPFPLQEVSGTEG